MSAVPCEVGDSNVIVFSFHLDHAAALTYIMEKVRTSMIFFYLSMSDHLRRRILGMAKGKCT